MAFVPIAMQLLPLIPGLVDGVFKIIQAVQSDPATPEDAKIKLAAASAHLQEVVTQVRDVRLPA